LTSLFCVFGSNVSIFILFCFDRLMILGGAQKSAHGKRGEPTSRARAKSDQSHVYSTNRAHRTSPLVPFFQPSGQVGDTRLGAPSQQG
jgi:hypothetical protein